MSESNSLLLYRVCTWALLEREDAAYGDAHCLSIDTSLGRFDIDNWYDRFNVARRLDIPQTPPQHQAESQRLLESGRPCITIKCQGVPEYLILHPEDMGSSYVKAVLMNAISNHSIPPDEPVIFHADRIIWDPFTDPHLFELYTHLTSNQD